MIPSLWFVLPPSQIVRRLTFLAPSLTTRLTTREQTLERCPNLALASVFFAPGTKGPCPTIVRGAGIFSPGLGYSPGIKINI